MLDKKLEKLLEVIVDMYIERGEPIGSKILYKINVLNMAPSTLRKYMNILEKKDFVFQPYMGAGRVPTIKGLSYYIDKLLFSDEDVELDEEFSDLNIARDNLKEVVELLGNIVDGVAFGFLKDDEYYYLGIHNLLKKSGLDEFEAVQKIVEYLESKKMIDYLSKRKNLKFNKLYYSFIKERGDKNIVAVLYGLVPVNNYKAILAILSPVRTNYKKNVFIMKKILGVR